MSSNIQRTWILPRDLDLRPEQYSDKSVLSWLILEEGNSELMNVGDLVYLWAFKFIDDDSSGVYGLAKVIEKPVEWPWERNGFDRVLTSPNPPIWAHEPHVEFKDAIKYQRTQKLRVGLQIEKIANKKEMIDTKWLEDDPVLYDLNKFPFWHSTHYLLPKTQETRLKALWDNTGRNWTREESVVGLWTYAQLIDKPISKKTDSLVTKSAVLVGRAVSGMYNKVLNFRSLDPRDERKGFDGVSETDRQVWTEFYNPQSKQIDLKALDEEFKQRWGNYFDDESLEIEDWKIGQSPEAIEVINEPIKENKKSNSGQGYSRDSRKNRAIETHAVEMAKSHYESNGFEVTNTGNYESFDLSCMKDGIEKRVEVKGTTTQGVSIILIKNEVEHAQSAKMSVDLVIVSEIEVLPSIEGPQTTGGIFKLIENWKPMDEDLSVATFSYKLKV